jgi:signal transduction histidine kinase
MLIEWAYSSRVRLVMDPHPMMVEEDEPLDTVAHRAMQRQRSKIYDQLVVTDQGNLVGIVSIREMLNTLAIQEGRRAEDIAAVNRRLKNEIVERKRAEESLMLANERLKDLDKMKTDFPSTVSHELRSPMTSILGFTEIIRDRLNEVVFPLVTSKDPKVIRAKSKVYRNLDIIISEGERLTGLINDLLDIAKLESGKVAFNFELLEMKGVLNERQVPQGRYWRRRGFLSTSR